MTNEIAVTYTGNDDPYKDRIYRSGLTFTKGQTRMLPEPLAARFLRHTDVFERADKNDNVTKKAKQKADEQLVEEVAVIQDDTKAILEQTAKESDTLREQENARFELHDRLASMDKAALIDWVHANYKQKMPGNYGHPRLLDMAKGFIDQYGMPA